MYAFSRDESLLLFMDGFGLTRMSQPAAAKRAKGVWQLKTDTKIMGSEAVGRVSVAASGELAATYEDLWDKSVLWALPELRASKRFDRFRESGVIMHPEGSHHIVLERDQLRLEPLVRSVLLPRRLDRPAPKARSKSTTLSLEGGALLDAWQLGEASPYVAVPLRIAHDGTAHIFCGGELLRARLDGDTLAIEWRRPLRAPEQVRVEIHGDAARSVVLVHEGPRWRVVERIGELERERWIESLGVPTIAGRYLAWQASPTRVIRLDLDSDAREEFSLERAADARATTLPSAGVGTLFAGAAGSLMMLLHHRESLVDLVAGLEIARKLPAKQLELRQAVLARASHYLGAASAVGATIELGRIELDDKHQSVSVTHRVFGAGTLVGAMLSASSQSAWHGAEFPGGWRMSGYGSHGAIACDEPIDVPALARASTLLASIGTSFAATLGFWANHVGDGQDLEPSVVAWLARALMQVIEQGPASVIDGEALAQLPAPSLAEAQAALAGLPSRVSELDYQISRVIGPVFNALFGADAALLWVRLYLELEWPHYGTPYYDLQGHAIDPLLDQHPIAAGQFRSWLTTHPTPTDDRRWYVEQLGRALEQRGG